MNETRVRRTMLQLPENAPTGLLEEVLDLPAESDKALETPDDADDDTDTQSYKKHCYGHDILLSRDFGNPVERDTPDVNERPAEAFCDFNLPMEESYRIARITVSDPT